MPELPEVETVKETLKKVILGKTITNIDVFYSSIIDNVTVDEFKNCLIGQSFCDIKRKGKYLIFVLNDYYLISHLRMEGKFFKYSDTDFSKHDHIVFYFDDFNIRYNDTRKFGRMYLFSKSTDIYNTYPLSVVANDVFEGVDENQIYSKLQRLKKTIKEALLDQSIISGLGNIYVDEVLFLSAIHPETKASNISLDDIRSIIDSSMIVLSRAIKLGGTTIKSFASSHGITGLFQNELRVHTKEVCPKCGAKIKKNRVGGRGTYFCPTCQQLKN